jgi:hypothetical protein
MKNPVKAAILLPLIAMAGTTAMAQKNQLVKVVKVADKNKVDIVIGNKLFTSFLYPDTLEKPVLYPVHAANGIVVTRGFPLDPKPGDPTDHPHHIGIWFNFENLNDLDFWNNSYAIKKEKKSAYGWVKTDRILQTSGGAKGILAYHANWTNQANDILLEETTRLEFSGTANRRVIDRITTLKAVTLCVFKDSKDGLLGLRLAHELQIPSTVDQKFTDNKGNVTIVKGSDDKVPTGSYLTSGGKTGDAAWGTRGAWCKVFGKMGADSISITIFDHPKNFNYPTFWHARGYGLFAANPLGQKAFTSGEPKNLTLQKGESVTFRYRIVVDNGPKTPDSRQLNAVAKAYTMKK